MAKGVSMLCLQEPLMKTKPWLKNYPVHVLWFDFFCSTLDKAKKKRCLVSGNPTDPTFKGPTRNFLGTSENFSSIFRIFWMIFMLFLYKNKTFANLPTLTIIETFLETRHLFFLAYLRSCKLLLDFFFQVEDFSSVHFVTISCVKMTNLNIKPCANN